MVTVADIVAAYPPNTPEEQEKLDRWSFFSQNPGSTEAEYQDFRAWMDKQK